MITNFTRVPQDIGLLVPLPKRAFQSWEKVIIFSISGHPGIFGDANAKGLQ